MRTTRLLCVSLLLLLLSALPASAKTVLCDPAYQNCRTTLLSLIELEPFGIDASVWFMEDMRFSAALIRAHQRGVRVRVLMNNRDGIPSQLAPLEAMRTAGIPMRVAKTWLHTKAMIFAGQGTLEISGANFTADAFRPVKAYENYVDEAIAFISYEPEIIWSAMLEFDNMWTDLSAFAEYGNAPDSDLVRYYNPMTKVPNAFVTQPELIGRLIALIRAETATIDIIIYRFTNLQVWHELHLAQERGVKVRMLIEPEAYYNWRTQQYPSASNMALGVYYAMALGADVKTRVHQGMTHEKLAIFHSQQRVLLGSQNYNEDEGGFEWNIDFHDRPDAFWWSVSHFGRKWVSKEFAPVVTPIQWW